MTQPAASITSYIMYLRLSCSLPVRRLQSSQRRCLQRLSTPSTKHHHVSTTCSSQCRRVLSSLSDGNKRNGPVPINRTPRGRASSSRATSSSSSTVNGHSHNNNHSNSKGFETLNDRAKRNGDDHNNLNNNQHQQFQYTNNNNNSNGEKHGPEHYLRGGLPCEPAAPPFFLADYGEESLYTLVLLRHGESEWNCHPHRFTGWVDVGLTKKGEMEARTAGRLLYENEIELDHAFTSVLRRASFSCNMALNMAKVGFQLLENTRKGVCFLVYGLNHSPFP